MKQLELYDQWAASYAITVGCTLVQVIQSHGSIYSTFVFDDTSGRVSQALGEWRSGNTMVRTRDFVKAYKQIKGLSRRQPAQMKYEVCANDTQAS